MADVLVNGTVRVNAPFYVVQNVGPFGALSVQFSGDTPTGGVSADYVLSSVSWTGLATLASGPYPATVTLATEAGTAVVPFPSASGAWSGTQAATTQIPASLGLCFGPSRFSLVRPIPAGSDGTYTLEIDTITFTFSPVGTGNGGTGGSGGTGGTGGTGGSGGAGNVAGGDPNLCQLQYLRGNMRDAIRLKLGLTPPIQYIPGAIAGEEPQGESYPGNFSINTAIADAIREINRRTGFHSSIALSVVVPPTTAVGPQFVPLQGIGGGPYQNLIRDVRRAVWDDGTTQVRLRARSFYDMDRQFTAFDMLAPDVPREFAMEAYQIGLLPGTSAGGTLILWAGTGLIGFCSDMDVMDELPIDYMAVIEDLATLKLRQMRPNEENARDQIVLYRADVEQGIKDIRIWLATINAEQQASLVPSPYRRNRWR